MDKHIATSNYRNIFLLLVVLFSVFSNVQSILEKGSLRANYPFDVDCPALPPHKANSVHELKPNDIKVVMAIGDSVTAGFGVLGWDVFPFEEQRGKSFSMGGDSGALSIPNLLRVFSPNLTGFSKGERLYGFSHVQWVDRLNAAESGADVTDLFPSELEYLVDQFNPKPNPPFPPEKNNEREDIISESEDKQRSRSRSRSKSSLHQKGDDDEDDDVIDADLLEAVSERRQKWELYKDQVWDGKDDVVSRDVMERETSKKMSKRRTSKRKNRAAGQRHHQRPSKVKPVNLSYQTGGLSHLKDEWKLLNVFIGANDLCDMCFNESFVPPQEYHDRLKYSLELVRTNVTKTFVNLVLLFNISGIYHLSSQSKYCHSFHRLFYFECDCLFVAGEKGDKIRQTMDNFAVYYNQQLYKIADEYKKLNYSDFAVVVQPFAEFVNVSSYDLSFFSDFDCFHPSLSTHQHFAVGLWNNMLTPWDLKKHNMSVTDTPICPGPDTFLYTN